MTPDQLRELVGAGESLTTEFKSDPINDTDLVEAVVCLANASGGFLLIGIGDDGSSRGLQGPDSNRADPVRVRALVEHRTEPHIRVGVEVVTHGPTQVTVITVPQATTVVATTGGKYLRRTIDVRGEPQCLPMRPNEVFSRAGDLGVLDFTAASLPEATRDDLSEAELSRFRELAAGQGDAALSGLSATDLLRALNLENPDGHINIGAVLLFGTESALARLVPAYELAFQVLDRLEVRHNEIGRKPLLAAMEFLTDRIEAHNPEEELQQGLLRIGLPRFARVAVRELVANALVHRDYTSLGMTIAQIDGDGLSIANPGGFPEGLSTSNVLVAAPKHRNPLLANAFQRAGVVERTGRGINRVFVSQLSIGHPAPDYSASTSTSVTALLRSGPADLELAGYIAEARMSGEELDLDALLVLHEVRNERRITSARAAELLQITPEAARSALNHLVGSGMLEARGERKARTYHLSAGLYRRLGRATEYVRTRGFDALQQEQMVLTYVSRHGAITRREAAQLCQLSPEQAGRLLRRLRDERKLEQIGERRHARYVEPGQA